MSRGKQWIALDHLKRKLFIKYELRGVLLRSLIKNQSLPLTYRYYAYFLKIKTIRWANLTQQKNRCSRTGRSQGVFKFVKYSRFVLRTESYVGNLPAFRKSSW